MSKRLEQEAAKTNINNELIEELLSQANPSELFGKGGLFQQLKKRLVERILESELDNELGYSRHSKIPKIDSNRRNSITEKTIIDDSGQKITIEVPRNREGEFEPKLIRKGVRRFAKFDDTVISLYARGMTMWYRTNLCSIIDGLKGFRDAINSIFPSTIVQLCIIHMVRNSVKYVSYKDLKEVTADLKQIYTANNESMANLALEGFAVKWDSRYPVILDIWKRNWTGIVPFLAFPEEIRRVIYITNTIELVNCQIHKIIKNKGVFPDDKSITKIIFLLSKMLQKSGPCPLENGRLL